MMQKIQKFGGAMFTPVLLFAFAGIVVGIGTLFTTQAIFGELASPESLWFKCWNVVLQGGWTVFRQLPLLFVVALPIGLAKKQNARCCMEALVLYITFNYFVSIMLSQWGADLGIDLTSQAEGGSHLTQIAGIETLDMGMFGALGISALVIFLHNRFYEKELPEWLGIFSGSTFVFMIGFFAMLPVAVLAILIWPQVQLLMSALQQFVLGAGTLGVGLFVFLEKLLIPFGLHHLLYSSFYFDNVVINGGIYSYWATQLPQLAASTEALKELAPWASYTATGFSKIFGCPGIALAFYFTAKPQNRKRLLALLIPITLTAVLCGVTEPIEFTFLFIAPVLFIVHAVLSALLAMVINLLGITGIFSGGLIEMASFNWIPLMGSHWQQYLLLFAVGLAFTGIWFVVFRFIILKLNLKTPGRQDEENVKFYSKSDYRASKSDEETLIVQKVLEALGGKENIIDVTNCATRLRVNIKDPKVVLDDQAFKALGTHGCITSGRSVQVIIGLSVAKFREQFENLL